MRKIQILDCTLRDGSYVLDFNFSLMDTLFISKVLFESGINYVEIGHGLGLGASKNKLNKSSLYEDNDYISSANQAKISKHNKIGSFCFTGNVSYTNFDKAKLSGLDFIRFAYEEKKLKKLKNDIEYCNKIGLEVHLNLIKTYKYSFKQVEKIVQKINKLNIKYLYIVDSSGGMTASELIKYIKTVKKTLKKNVEIGFHGHNNLGIGNANCIAAIENGASIVDTSMLGMGRGAGNAITESLAAYMQREKMIKDVDIKKILNFIKNYLGKIFPQKNLIENVLTGKSYFHDSEIDKLKTISKKNKLNYLSLLDENSFRKGINISKILKINKKNSITDYPYSISDLKLDHKLISDNYHSINYFKKDLSAQSKKKDNEKILTICRGKTIGMKIYCESDMVIGHIISNSKKMDVEILKKFKEYKIFFDEGINQNKYLCYSETEIKEKACLDVISSSSYNSVEFIGKFKNNFKNKIKKNLRYNKKSNKIYVVSSKRVPKFIKNSEILILKDIINIDTIGNKLKVIKPNYGLVLAMEVKRILDYSSLVKKASKRIKINKHLYVVGKGIVGRKNDIIVDNTLTPNRIIGQSDGFGGIKSKIYLDGASKKSLVEWMFNLCVK